MVGLRVCTAASSCSLGMTTSDSQEGARVTGADLACACGGVAIQPDPGQVVMGDPGNEDAAHCFMASIVSLVVWSRLHARGVASELDGALIFSQSLCVGECRLSTTTAAGVAHVCSPDRTDRATVMTYILTVSGRRSYRQSRRVTASLRCSHVQNRKVELAGSMVRCRLSSCVHINSVR